MTIVDPRLNLVGHFACGFGLHVSASCCGKSFESATASYVIEVHIPQLPILSQDAMLVTPQEVAPVSDADVADERERSLKWGVVIDWAAHKNGQQIPTSVRVLRLGFKALEAVADSKVLSGVRESVAAELDAWWERFSTWVAVLTGQDPRDYLRAVAATRHEPVWTWVDGEPYRRGQGISEDAARRRRQFDPLDEATLTACMKLAARGDEPPAEWTFIRDARSAVIAGDYRRAVIDAGTAAELAITELLDQHLSVVEPTVAEALLARARALEQRSSLMKDLGAGTEPKGFTNDLKKPRNIAAHKGHAPSKDVAEKAIAVALDLVEQSTPRLSLVPSV
ncbi:hypothetical protein [Prescottella equi]|uniref:hypothetical protein n=1 Tax=Rhodococcus hoagii TaxID=43767 RepID=UPI00111BDB22|nr:hypothetical protein [Prescottella equi]